MNNYPKKIVCLGDSITCDWNSDSYVNYWKDNLLADNYHVEIVNSGVNGETAQDGYYRLENDVLAHNPDLVTIMFGHNEIGRGVGVDHYENYLNLIIQKINHITPQTLIWVLSPNKVSHPNKQDEYSYLLEKLTFPDERFDYIDVWNCFSDSNLADFYTLKMNWGSDETQDFIHPNIRGNKMIGEYLSSIFKEKYNSSSFVVSHS